MYEKKITLSFTITDFQLLFVAVAILHIAISSSYIAISPPVLEKKKEISKVSKIPVSIKSKISKNTRSSRFSSYMKTLEDYKINQELLKESEDSLAGLTEQEGQILKDLTNDQINKILSEQDKQLSEDIAKAKEIFNKNQKKYQACYEDALLKDKFLNGVSNILVSIDKGRVSNVETKFKGDGHKSALNILNGCLKEKSSGLNVGSIKGEHLINFNLVFKS